ncbi:MAG: NADH-quinone oxidoreductase subunit J [Acidimicrobiales bacterium]|jgi:NADH-quinone oxidoreductase subunit J|nr:NADH-quinone oxidoreductase subunit J [Acidimicrobiales bacterium]|tara:strand:+ start:8719 stop:9264 length:546 start_codon:yes stop_codon:yes gene_type:complete
MNVPAALEGFDSLTSGDTVVAQNIAFGILSVVMVVAALRMVTTRNVVHAALYLVIVLAGAAGIFILLGAEFVGVTQVLVYIGAIVVLFLFGIMLTRGALGEDEEANTEKRRMAALVGVLVLVVTGGAVLDSFGDAAVNRSAPSLTSEIGDTIFSQYIVPFEAVSVLLLATLIGAIVVARQD